METRREILLRTLEETIRDSQAIAAVALTRIREEALLQPMGVELISLYFLTAKPTPEVAKALEAPYRETMLRQADEAIYARRAAAVEEERKIKENERNTEIRLEQYRFDWEADYLRFSVREPFVSRTTRADLVTGTITAEKRLEVISQMPQNGLIFSDGIEEDYLPFNSGAIASIGLAEKRVNLVTRV